MRERTIKWNPWTGSDNADNEIKPEHVRKLFDEYVSKIAYRDLDPADPELIRKKYRRMYALMGEAKREPMPPHPDAIENPTPEQLRDVEDIATIVVAAQIAFCGWAAETLLY